MEKVLYTDFENIGTVIDDMTSSPLFRKAVTRANLYKFWDNILPEKFKKRSVPFMITHTGVMVIACENHIIAQELALYKVILMKKFDPYLKSLKMRITDLKFDPRKWTAKT